MNKKELEQKYDRKTEIDWKEYNIEKKQPLIIKHGFEPSPQKNQDGEPIKIDFRGLRQVDDIHIHAPEAETEIEHFDIRTDGDGIIAWIKKDWSDTENPLILYWMEPTKDQIMVQEMTGIEHIETPKSRGKRQ